MAVLAASVLVKLFMFFLNRNFAKAIGSETLKATAADSVSDAVATAAVLLSLLISQWTGFSLDGYMGAAVAVFIAFTGGSILKETVSRLLGKAPDAEVVKEIERKVLSFDGVRGLHDLTVHSYGKNKLYATVHVEVDSRMPIMDAHDLADRIEKDFAADTDIAMTVHIDPLVFDDPKINRYREEAERIVANIDPRFKMHDFRVAGGTTHSNLVFDVAVPFDCTLSEAEILSRIKDGVSLLGENLDAVVTVERQNVEYSSALRFLSTVIFLSAIIFMANFIGIPFLNPLCLCLRIFSANNRPYRIQSVAIKFGNIMQPEKSEFMPGISDRFRQKGYNVCMNSAIKAGIQVFIKPIDFINIFFVAERQQALRSPLRIFLRKEIFYHDYFSFFVH